MKNKIIAVSFFIIILSLCTSCFSEKDSPFYDSEWIMSNFDQNNQQYYHHLILNPDHSVMLRVSYYDSTNIIVWKGKYKINNKKFNFNFDKCIRYENGEVVGNYTSGKLINYYKGEYLYSVSLIGETKEKQEYHLKLIRPKNHFLGEAIDIFGNPLVEFIKMDKTQE